MSISARLLLGFTAIVVLPGCGDREQEFQREEAARKARAAAELSARLARDEDAARAAGRRADEQDSKRREELAAAKARLDGLISAWRQAGAVKRLRALREKCEGDGGCDGEAEAIASAAETPSERENLEAVISAAESRAMARTKRDLAEQVCCCDDYVSRCKVAGPACCVFHGGQCPCRAR